MKNGSAEVRKEETQSGGGAFPNVKRLLATGLLEGAPVKYIFKKHNVEVQGFIKGEGYLCGCSSCNYAQVLTAYEFERHAGVESSHPNDHIFLENGKTLHEVVKSLEINSLELLPTEIEGFIGGSVNLNLCNAWRKGEGLSRRTSHKGKQIEPESESDEEWTSDSPQTRGWDSQKIAITSKANQELAPKFLDHSTVSTTSSTLVGKRAQRQLSDGHHPESQSPSKNQRVESLNDGLVLKRAETIAPCTPNKKIDAKINGNFSPSSHLLNVKGLLSTGLLEGVEVLYKKDDKEILRGNIKDLGYQCGCSSCNYTTVLSANEFEKHAGVTTNNQNNHVFLRSGITIYGLVKQLIHTPLGSLGEVIEEKIGGPANMKCFEDWKDSFRTMKHGLQKLEKTRITGVENLRNPPNPHSEHHSIKNSLGPATEGSFAPASNANDKFCFPGPATDGNFDSASISSIKISSTGPAIEGNTCPVSSILTSPLIMKHSVLESKLESEKRIAKMSPMVPDLNYLLESTVSPGQPQTTVQGGAKKRDNDLHRSIFMENGLPDGSELTYCSKGQVLLKGFKVETGIMCGCCGNKVSPSQFEAHAGCAAKRQPYRNIYTSNGSSLHELSISLSNGQKLTTICSEDLCTICGTGGDLIPCDGCPRAFHTVCLKLQCYPDGEWYCPYCKDNLGTGTSSSVLSPNAFKPITLRLRRILKAPTDELGGCVLCKGYTFSREEFDAKTIVLCCQCEKEYHVGCLKDHRICDLKDFPGEWFCCLDCDVIHVALRNLVFHGPKVVPESLLSILKRKNEEDDLTNEPEADVQWQLLSGKHQFSESLLSKASEIFKDAFYPIVQRGDDLIPAMIYGRDAGGQYFEGMYCVVLTVRSVIVSAGILRIFGKHIAELPLVATPKDRQGKGYFRTLLSLIEGLLSRLKVEVLMLPIADNEQSMWINKFGFKKMKVERLLKYAMEHPMLMFEKTTILEKAVPRSSNDGRDGAFTFSFPSTKF